MQRNLLLISSYTGLGGGERVHLNLMEALDRERYTPHLVVPADGQFARAARDLGISTHILPFRGITTLCVPALWQRFPIARRLAELVNRLDIHVIHSDYHALPFAVAAGHAAHIPVLFYSHGWWFPIHPWQKRFFCEQVTQIATVSQSVRDRWLERSPFLPPDSIPVIFPGVNADYFHPDIDGAPIRAKLGIDQAVPLVVMLARFQHVKGHDIFQAMAQRIYEHMPEARFAVAGENVFGARKDETLKRSIVEHARTDPILSLCLTYLGHYDDPRPVVAAADVVVCSSRFESLGMVHLESMAMARPMVSMNNGGPAETILDGVTGYLVPPEDPDALADRVLHLLCNPALRGQMGQAGRARVLENFTAQAYAARVSDLFDALI